MQVPPISKRTYNSVANLQALLLSGTSLHRKSESACAGAAAVLMLRAPFIKYDDPIRHSRYLVVICAEYSTTVCYTAFTHFCSVWYMIYKGMNIKRNHNGMVSSRIVISMINRWSSAWNRGKAREKAIRHSIHCGSAKKGGNISISWRILILHFCSKQLLKTARHIITPT